jgi:hypothetical protein
VDTAEQYGSSITTRPPGFSTRTASPRKRVGRGTWWNTSTMTRFATDVSS